MVFSLVITREYPVASEDSCDVGCLITYHEYSAVGGSAIEPSKVYIITTMDWK